MTYFLKRGNGYYAHADVSIELDDKLPVGNFLIKKDQFEQLYFEQVDSFSFNEKRYGDNCKNTERIIQTFMSRDMSTGVMLSGEKGSGKSLLAKTVSIRAAELGMPTVIINEPYCGDNFNQLIQQITQPCVILFDEFEKVYNSEQQEMVLTLLDGVFPSKKLFIFTCNDKYRIDSHMKNRPGRIFYFLEFKGLEVEFIKEYCEDNLKNKSYIGKICKVSTLFSSFNFDSLKALVEEMNRYDESPEEALKLLNIKPEFGSDSRFEYSLFKGDRKLHTGGNNWIGNPLQAEINIHYDPNPEGDDDWTSAQFTTSDIKEVDDRTGRFVFRNKNNETLVLTRNIETQFNYFNAF